MINQNKLIVSHAPFWHNGSGIAERSYNVMGAALLAVLAGFMRYGMPAVGVVCLSVSMAMFWELAYTRLTKMPDTIGDGNAAMFGLVLAMMLPSTTPWWIVVIGTFLMIIIGRQIYGGIGSNAFHPAVLATAILIISWKNHFNFDGAYVAYNFDFLSRYPLGMLKNFGPRGIAHYDLMNLFLGRQVGGIGSGCGLALVLGGIYLMLRGYIRWEVSVSFLVGVFLTAQIFNMVNPERFAGPLFHILTGYTLLAAFFLITEDSSSPVNPFPMVIYGLGGGLLVVLIRNIGAHTDGTLYAVLTMNLVNPLLDKIRPKALGKVA